MFFLFGSGQIIPHEYCYVDRNECGVMDAVLDKRTR